MFDHGAATVARLATARGIVRLLCAQCSGLQHLRRRPAMTGRTAFCKELFMQSEIDHLGSYCGAKFG